MTIHAKPPRHAETLHEPLGVNVLAVVCVGAGLLLLLIASLAISAGVVRRIAGATGEPNSLSEKPTQGRSTELQVEPNQARELQQLKAQWTKRLNSYAWLTESEDRARIPIERAMEILARRDLASPWAPGETSAPQPPPLEGEQDSP